MTVEDVARIAHEANRAYCATLGDFSQPEWGVAPGWQVKSAIAGVRFHLANPTAGPAASHESWLRGKEADGWKYGPEKNEELKTHPCYLPYDQLPVAQRRKDDLFIAVVHTFRDLVTE